MKIIIWELDFFVIHSRIISAAKRVEFVSDRLSCIVCEVTGVISLF